MFRRRTAVQVAATVLSALVLTTGCSKISEEGPRDDAPRAKGGQVVVGEEDEPTGFNYASSKDSFIGVRDVVESVHYFAAKTRPDGSLSFVGLESEPTLVSEDPQVVEWTIADEATWSDGSPVTTADITYHYEAVVDPDHDVASRVGYEDIETLEVVDDKTFRATFKRPYGDFRGLWQAIPQAAFMEAQGGPWEQALDDEPGPAAGPYMFEGWRKGESLSLVPNPEWRGDPAPTLDRLVFRFLPDSATVPDAIRNGDVDAVLAQAQVDLMQDLEAVPGLQLETVVGPNFEHLVLNTEDPVVGDPAVRKAIALGLNRPEIVEALVAPFYPEAEPLGNMVIPDSQAEGYQAHDAAYADQHVDAAREALEGAGWVEGADGVRERDGQRLVIEFATTSDNERREQTLELIKSQLAPIGIDVEIETCPSDCLFSDRLPNGKFQVALKSWSGSPFPVADARARFVTGGGDNYSRYSSADVDEAAAEAGAALEPEEQLRLANQMDELLWRDLPMIPLFQTPYLAANSDRVTGVEPNATRDGLMWNSEAWGRVG